jgi:hypothetical protein
MVGDMGNSEETLARIATAKAALAEIERIAENGMLPDAELERLHTKFDQHLRMAQGSGEAEASLPRGELENVRFGIIESQRRALLALRRNKQIGDDVLQKLIRELDIAEVALTLNDHEANVRSIR